MDFRKYISNFKDFILSIKKEHLIKIIENKYFDKIIKIIEIFIIFFGLFFTYFAIKQGNENLALLSKQVEQGNKNINLLTKQVNQGNENIELFKEQLNQGDKNLSLFIKTEQVKIINELSNQLSSGKNREILWKYYKKSVKNGEFTERQILDLLDVLEMIQWARQKFGLADDDVRVNFEYAISIVCKNEFLYGKVKQYGYSGIKNILCKKFVRYKKK